MSMINVQNLSFAYDGLTPVFENVSFRIDTDWRLGFVGRNGRGKTTFLKLLAGEYEYSGSITSSVSFTYFPFAIRNVSAPSCDVVAEACPAAEEWKILRELSLLEIDAEALYRPFDTLSHGERTKILLAGLFASDNNFLLIDEPTNHLDCASRLAVSKYLRSKKGFILVSHDRAFLDGCVDHILSVNKTNIEVTSGDFSIWLSNFENRQAYEAAENERLKKDIARLNESMRRTSGWADKVESTKNERTSAGLRPDKGFIGHKSAKMAARAKAIENRQQKAVEQKSALLKNAERAPELKLSPLCCPSERLIGFSGVSAVYGERVVNAPVSFDVTRGARIALDGKNGSGKSSLMRIIVGEDVPHTGSVTRASGLIVSYMPQSTAGLCGNLSDFARERGVDESLFKTILRKTGFSRSDFDVDISAFSEGQKKKVLIAKSLCERAHLYVWDEPLNYIDIYSRMQIERLLLEFKPTMIFVEHDRAFRAAVATEVVELHCE